MIHKAYLLIDETLKHVYSICTYVRGTKYKYTIKRNLFAQYKCHECTYSIIADRIRQNIIICEEYYSVNMFRGALVSYVAWYSPNNEQSKKQFSL